MSSLLDLKQWGNFWNQGPRARVVGSGSSPGQVPWAILRASPELFLLFRPLDGSVTLTPCAAVSVEVYFLPFAKKEGASSVFPSMAKPGARGAAFSALMVITSAPPFRHRSGCTGSTRWHTAHKSYLLPAGFRVLEESLCLVIKTDWNNEQEAGALWDTHLC
jgi:hypothetical protein